MYLSLQGDDSISIFTIDPATGVLSWQENVAVKADRPSGRRLRKNFLHGKAGQPGNFPVTGSITAQGTLTS